MEHLERVEDRVELALVCRAVGRAAKVLRGDRPRVHGRGSAPARPCLRRAWSKRWESTASCRPRRRSPEDLSHISLPIWQVLMPNCSQRRSNSRAMARIGGEELPHLLAQLGAEMRRAFDGIVPHQQPSDVELAPAYRRQGGLRCGGRRPAQSRPRQCGQGAAGELTTVEVLHDSTRTRLVATSFLEGLVNHRCCPRVFVLVLIYSATAYLALPLPAGMCMIPTLLAQPSQMPPNGAVKPPAIQRL